MAQQDIRQRIIIDARDGTLRGTRSARQNLTKLEGTVKRLENTFLGFAGLDIASNLFVHFKDLSDTALDLNSKMKLVTTSSDQFTKAQENLLDVALKHGSAIEGVTTLYTRVSRPMSDMNYTMEQTAKFTDAITAGMRVSGATTTEATSSMIQLSQAMAAGVLRGEEYNSIAEQSPFIIEQMGIALNKTQGELREMANTGQLTSKVVIDAMLKQSDAVIAQAESMPLTIGRSLENVKSQIIKYFQDNTGINQWFATTIQEVSTGIAGIMDVLIPGIMVGIAYLARALVKLAASKVKAMVLAEQLMIRERNAAVAAAKHAQAQEAAAVRKVALANKELADETKLAAFRARNHVTRLAEENTRVQANILRLRGLQQELALEMRLLQSAINSERNAAVKLRLQGEQIILAQRQTAMAGQLTAAEARLTLTEQQQTAAINQQTVAYNANRAAQRASMLSHAAMVNSYNGQSQRIQALAQANINRSAGWAGALIQNNQRVINTTMSGMSRIGGMLMGWPAMVGLIAYQIAGHYIDMDVAGWALIRGLQRIGVAAQNIGSALFDTETFDKAMARFDAETDRQADEMIKTQEAKKKGYSSLIEYEKALDKEKAENEEKLKGASKRQELNRIATIKKAEDDLHKLKMKGITSFRKLLRASDEEAAAGLKAKIEGIKAAAEFESVVVASLDGTYDNSFAARQAKALKSNKEILQAQIDSLAARRAEWDTYYSATLVGLDRNGKTYLTVSQQHQAKLAEIDKKSVRALSSAITEMVGLRNGYLDSVKAGMDYISNLERDAAAFTRQMREDELTEYQKSADAQQRIAEAQDLLRKASALDEVKDAEEIKSLRELAMSDLKSIASDEKSRAANLDKYSLDEIQASNNKTEAFNLYHQVVKDSVTSRKALNDVELNEAEKLKVIIEEKAESLNELQVRITELDALVKTNRELIITADTSEAEKKVNALIDKINEKLGSGSAIKIGSSDVVESDADTTTVTPIEPITKLNTGGKVPGVGDTDTVPAMLTPGEFVVNKDAVRALVSKYGSDALAHINNGNLPQFLNTGGEVKKVSAREAALKRMELEDAGTYSVLLPSPPAYVANSASTGEGNTGKLIDSITASITNTRASTANDNSWQNAYYDHLTSVVTNLDGKSESSIRNIRNQIGNALRILELSPRRTSFKEYSSDIDALESIITQINTSIANAPAYVSDSETESNSNKGLNRSFGNLSETKGTTKTSTSNTVGTSTTKSGGYIPQPVRLTAADNAAAQTKISMPDITAGLDTVAASIVGNSKVPTSTASNTSLADTEPTVVIELKVGDDSAKGSFSDNAATLKLLNELKMRGLTNNG